MALVTASEAATAQVENRPCKRTAGLYTEDGFSACGASVIALELAVIERDNRVFSSLLAAYDVRS